MTRKDRALHQRLFLLNYKELSPDNWEFLVQGSTGNNYTILFSPRKQLCDCPDSVQVCKHILFIIARVGNDRNSYQKIENENIYLLNPNFSQCLKERLQNIEKQINNVRDITECAICFEELSNKLDQCEQCKQVFHKNCIQRWTLRQDSCPMCRGPWDHNWFK